MSTTIESLELDIKQNSSSAVQGIGALSASLTKLKSATKGGVGLTTVANQIRNLNTALNSTDTSKIDKLSSSLEKLKSLGGLKISSSIASQLKNIGSAVSSLTGVDFSGISKMSNGLSHLDGVSKSAAFARIPNNVKNLTQSTKKLSSANNTAKMSYINLYAKLSMIITSVRSAGGVIASWLKQSNKYVEDLNLFTVALGDGAPEAQKFAETVSEIMGIDPADWLRNQGVFNTIIKGFGVVNDKALIMSKNLTQLGYDISSFYNISAEDAFSKLQSGIAGELEPLRRLGYDLSVARLQQEAYNLGITKSVSAMTQAEKSQLRYYAIMTQVKDAQGDMARTLNAPANQLRILQAQVTQCARALGNIFIPALKAVLPYAIAVAKVISLIANKIASLFGFSLPEIDYSGISAGAGAVADAAQDAEDGYGGAAKAAKKLKDNLLGIDELNIIRPDDDTGTGGSGGSGGGGVGGGGFDIDPPQYDFLGGLVETKVGNIVKRMKEWLGLTKDISGWSDFFHTRLGHILTTVGAIGLGMAAWKVSKGVLNTLEWIGNLKKSGLGAPLSIAVGVSLLITGIALEGVGIADAVQNALDGENFAQIIVGGILNVGSGAFLGKGIAGWITKAFAGSAVATALKTAAANLGLGSATAAGAALASGVGAIIAGIPAYLVGVYDALTHGLNWMNGLLIPAGATAAGAGIGTIIGACAGPIGAGIGALIGLAIGLVTDGIIAITEHWGEITEWFNSTCATIGKFFSDLWQSIVDVWSTCAEWFNTNVIQPVAEFFTGLWDGISTAASTCWSAIVEFFSPAINWFSELFGSIFQTISDIFYDIGVIARGCWEIIKAVWGIVSEWFSKHITTPIATFFSNMWSGIKDKAITAWNGIKSVFSVVSNWFNTNVIQPVAGFFTGLWDGFTNGAKNAWEGVKSVFSTVATFFRNTFENAWRGIVNVFSTAGEIFVDIKDGIVSAFKTVVNGIIRGLNKVVSVPFDGINTALKKIKDIEIVGLRPFSDLRTIHVPSIPLLAGGGIITPKNVPTYAGGASLHGSMFLAGENGAEMVGHINGTTEVLNRFQMGQIMHSSIIAGMAQYLPIWRTLNSTLVTSANAIVRSVLVSADAVNSHLAVQATYDPSNFLSQSVYDESESVYRNSRDESTMASAMRDFYREYVEPTLREIATDAKRQADKDEKTIVQIGNRTINDAVVTQQKANGYVFAN